MTPEKLLDDLYFLKFLTKSTAVLLLSQYRVPEKYNVAIDGIFGLYLI